MFKKIILSLFLIFALAMPAQAANKFWWANCLTGGGDCLDGIDGASLTAGDAAAVVLDAGSTTPDTYFYRVYASSSAENSPFVVAPDSNPGTLRWHLVNLKASSLSAPKQSGVAGDVGLYEANSTDTDNAGFRGPDSISANTSYRGKLPNARPTSPNTFLIWTNSGESGTGTPTDPYVQTLSWADLDDYSLVGQTFYIGTTQVAINRASGALTLAGITLTTPDIGAATGTSLLATGRIDGTVGVVTSTANSATTISSTNNKACYYMNIGDSDAHSIYTLPTPVGGEQYCVTNYTGITTKPKFQAPANVYIVSAGVITGTAGSIIAGGALGDSACAVAVDSTHYVIYIQKGTWTPSSP